MARPDIIARKLVQRTAASMSSDQRIDSAVRFSVDACSPDGIAYNGSTGTAGAYLGFRNRSGRDDLVLRPQKADATGKHVICNAAGGCNEADLPQAVRRFGWRNLISWN